MDLARRPEAGNLDPRNSVSRGREARLESHIRSQAPIANAPSGAPVGDRVDLRKTQDEVEILAIEHAAT